MRLRRNNNLLWILLILLLGSGLRVYRLDSQSLWYDEGFSIYLARMPLARSIAETARDIHPPFYYHLLHFWIQLTGDSAFATRFLSVLFGVLIPPLLFAVGRQTWGEIGGTVAALFGAVSPFYIRYAQETRSYTLVTFLSLLSAYLLLRITAPNPKRWQRWVLWVAYLFVCLVGTYTNYFFFLALIFEALWFSVDWLSNKRSYAHLIPAFVAVGAWTLAYAPWLPHLLNQYRNYTGYWSGRVSLARIWQGILVTLFTGEGTSEKIGLQVAKAGTLILICGIVLISAQAWRKSLGERAHVWRPLAFLLAYLIIPLSLMALLFSFRAKAEPRYVIVASPSLFLLLGGLVSVIAQNAIEGRPPWGRRISRLGMAMVMCFMIATSLYAVRNLLLNPAYAKPDFRGAVAYLREHHQPDESIILVAGHAFPVFDYYGPDLDRYPIPADPVPSVRNAIDYDVVGKLNAAIEGKQGVWLLLWQNEAFDPFNIVSGLLTRVGQKLPVDRSFAQVQLEHFRLPPGVQFSWSTGIQRPSGARFGNLVTLIEARLNTSLLHPGDELQLTLYWRVEGQTRRSYKVFTHLLSQDIRVVAQHDSIPAGWRRPTDFWVKGEIIEDRHRIVLGPQVSSGLYEIEVGLYDPDAPGMPRLPVVNEHGVAVDDRVVLGTVTVASPFDDQ